MVFKPSFDNANNIPHEIYERLSEEQKKLQDVIVKSHLMKMKGLQEKTSYPVLRKYEIT